MQEELLRAVGGDRLHADVRHAFDRGSARRRQSHRRAVAATGPRARRTERARLRPAQRRQRRRSRRRSQRIHRLLFDDAIPDGARDSDRRRHERRSHPPIRAGVRARARTARRRSCPQQPLAPVAPARATTPVLRKAADRRRARACCGKVAARLAGQRPAVADLRADGAARWATDVASGELLVKACDLARRCCCKGYALGIVARVLLHRARDLDAASAATCCRR